MGERRETRTCGYKSRLKTSCVLAGARSAAEATAAVWQRPVAVVTALSREVEGSHEILSAEHPFLTDLDVFGSLERKLQRPILAKSRTLPSIPQSPTVSRVHRADLIGGSPPRRKNPPLDASHPKACTLPPAAELWRLEDDMEGEDEPEHGGCNQVRPRSQSPFSHFRARAAYLRKSVSADDHLDMGDDFSPAPPVEVKPSRSNKGKLKRNFHWQDTQWYPVRPMKRMIFSMLLWSKGLEVYWIGLRVTVACCYAPV
ncbi:Basement membrane-specific heparan sulfate proteoglycan core protein [Dissostichus eleginoides]|uniref:Basement membrane-specific heparan sulfate proteoglycan core protein n=1 Tax=Dissostichus eleginoides TaxID=100907 RepID=A0AAD9EXU0_DISEL|nr:Basement membrane-specific heparan sulfate proteoglycan core protein [Dissostichus eleginoides]